MSDLDEIEMTPQERQKVNLMIALQEQGFNDATVEAMVEAAFPSGYQTPSPADDLYQLEDYDMPPLNLNFDFDEKAAFKEDPEKLSFFKGAEQLKPHVSTFVLKSDSEFVLQGKTYAVRKMNMNDVLRLVAKVPKWAQYLGFNAPKMLVDELTGKYRWAETILKLFERAFGDYDLDLNRPTDFSLSVLEEVVDLMGLQNEAASTGEKGVAFLLEQDPEEVLDAVAALIACNQKSFLRVYNALGPIKALINSIFGLISNRIKLINAQRIPENSEMSQSPSAT